jgi:hypothetical protein
MNSLRSVRYAFAAAAAVSMLGGCGGTMVPLQQGAEAPSDAAQMRAGGIGNALRDAATSSFDAGRSWMAPDAKKTKTLLYVADEATGDVYVYSYPGGKLKGTLTGFSLPSGMCSNKAGDVFILNGGGSTIEVFAHGGKTPIRTLDLPGYPELNCSVDPTTGNLALGALLGSCGDCIAVFANGSGTPTTYTPSGQNGIPGCGYDNHGNLFCDAYGSGNKFALYELPAGSATVTSIAVSGASGLRAGSMQWDGKYLAFGSGAQGTIYQIQLSGSTGTVVGSTGLTGAGYVWQFWIKKTRIIAPTYGGSVGAIAGYWSYPAGGSATKTITGFSQPDGATLSTIKK